METSTPLPIETTANPPARWQIILAIARKDVFVMAKTPGILLMILLPLCMHLLFQVIFAGLGSEQPLRVALYDPAGSPLAELLATLPDVEWQPVASQAEFETALAEAEAGIVVAPDFERALTNGNQPDLTVWLNPQPGRQSELADFQRRLMEELWRVHEAQAPVRLTWRPVDELTGQADDDQDANTFLLTMMIITGMAMTGLTISLLIVEEKDARTLDALLLSPAGKAEFIAGKGLAVFLYTLLLMAAMLLISGEPNGAWGATLAAVFLGSLFMVGSGLLLGTVFNTRHQCNAWGGLLTFVLMMPAMLVVWQPSPIWLTLLRLIPTYYLTDALTMALNQTVILGRLGLDLVVLTGFVLLVFFLTQQRLRGSNWLVG